MRSGRFGTNKLGTIAIWAGLLGAVGFTCGFFGPIVLSPEANQGPLLGILITGPGGAILGAFLGVLVCFLPLSPRIRCAALVVAAVALAGVTLYFSTPEPQYQASIVDAEVRACARPATLEARALERWDEAIARATWATPRAGWKEEIARTLREDDGVVVELLVFRRSRIYENRRPWNRGTLTATAWKADGESRSYYTRIHGGSCERYEVVERASYLARGESSEDWPPAIPSSFLGLQLVEPVPSAYRALIPG